MIHVSEVDDSIHRAAFYDALPSGYVVLDSRGRITTVNRTLAHWLGIDRSRLCNEELHRFLPPFEAGRFAAHIDICLQRRDAFTIETMLQLPDETLVPVALTSQAEILGSKPLVHVMVTRLTPGRNARQDRHELQRDHEVLIRALSHDLRGPLVIIRQFVRLVLDDYSDRLHADVADAVQRIERGAQRAEAILAQLLAYVELREGDPVCERIEMEQFVKGVIAASREAAARRRAEIAVIPPMPAVRACPRLLADVVYNLLANALDYASPDHPPHITLSCEECDGAIVLKVDDDGVGIDPQDQKRIFEPGERLASRRGGPGAGFGLAIVRRAMERMHGRVWVESAPGHGSCFHLSLPRG